jgi:hypothetical protein
MPSSVRMATHGPLICTRKARFFYRSWLYLFRTKKALVNEINSMRVEIKA